ncbi:MAG: hypothetical protein N3F09_09480 [Bacteroidia bacterium]|nr:hypothetical protein [Bacteroidia bacterium]
MAIAFYLPFELFLFSYAFLGPLHYLTEINWLRERKFFTLNKNDVWILTGLCIIATFMNFFPTKNSFSNMSYILLIALYLSVLFVITKNNIYRLLLAVPGLIVFHRLNEMQSFQLFVGLYLPTIIHVLIFTWLFMIYGILKEPSKAGWISVATLMGCVTLIFALPAHQLKYPVSDYVKNAMGPFALVNASMVNLFGLDELKHMNFIYENSAGFIVMRFMAFAYTYHYLNWFSKTSVIKWHQTERKNMIIILILWVISVAFYAYDYKLGMEVLFFLSFLHVFLEFPLNVVSIRGIGEILLKRLA